MTILGLVTKKNSTNVFVTLLKIGCDSMLNCETPDWQHLELFSVQLYSHSNFYNNDRIRDCQLTLSAACMGLDLCKVMQVIRYNWNAI